MNPLLAFLLSCHVLVTLKIQVNFRSRSVLEVLMILSYGFSEFLYYLCSRGQRIAEIPTELPFLGGLKNL